MVFHRTEPFRPLRFVHGLNRINCVLISRCEYPSRNPTSPLDCRAGGPSPPLLLLLLPCLCYMLHLQPSFSSLYASGRPRRSDTSAHYRRRAREGAAAAGTGATTCLSLLGTPRTGWWICLSYGFGSGARISSHGTKKTAFFRAIRGFVSPGVLTKRRRSAFDTSPT